MRPRVIAFYLPQFHPIPQNDAWWGRGFTEWTNVTRARPLFPGHAQPHLPADLGFYDLRLPEARAAQAELAREYGVAGFCYYHYWFNGRRLLERPFQEVLTSGEPDFPFCLCWANEAWTRGWDGREGEILMPQLYSQADEQAHMRYLAEAFADPRYIRVDGRPLFAIYRANQLPNSRATTDTMRDEAHRLGLGDLFLCRVESAVENYGDPRPAGFDASIEFQPRWGETGQPVNQKPGARLARRLRLAPRAYSEHLIFDYPTFVQRMCARPPIDYPRFPCVFPSWDNSARRKRLAWIFRNASPDVFAEWLTSAATAAASELLPEPLIFVNAWNEWAEGTHLEPCQRWGRAFLEQVARLAEDPEDVTAP